MPLVDKCLTLEGSAVKEPKNLVVPIGTPVSHIVEQAGGLCCEPGKLIFGGPMMGHTRESMDSPIIKATNAVIIFSEKDSRPVKSTACIHCGRCVANCPLGLNPTAFARAMEIDDQEERYAVLDKENVMLCMECGCCSYVCPARRPLVDTNKDAKRFVKKTKAAKDAMEKKEGGN